MLLKEVVNGGFPQAFLAEFYRNHVIYSPGEIEQIRQMDGDAFREIHSVAGFFSGHHPEA
jgi:hypothetical protein